MGRMMWHGRTACAIAPVFEGASVLLRTESPWPFIFSRVRIDPRVTACIVPHVSTLFVVGSTRDTQHKCPVATWGKQHLFVLRCCTPEIGRTDMPMKKKK